MGARRWVWAGAALIVVVAIGAALLFRRGAGPGSEHAEQTPEAANAEFVGSQRCASCHEEQFDGWMGSQHQQAMQVATEKTVLGDFSGVRFTDQGVTTTFLRRDSLFFVHTIGPDGQEGEFQVRFTFGVYPLQQYLIELEGGRIQPLTVAWDSRPASEGGQRWMTLYPGERIEHTDELHWTGRLQNWNFMCADCHSTNVQKNYDREADAFATSWSEISVGCEACHGPGSRHLEWAASADAQEDYAGLDAASMGLLVALDEREGVTWRVNPSTGKPQRSTPRATQREISVCAQCHSRRAQIVEGYTAGKPFLDYYLPSLLMPGLYHADGQQRDEVYIHASFLQSRMFAAGVTCSDCHDPHSQRLRAEGNAVCTGCHTPERYDTPEHHFHPADGEAAQCVSCHMPETTYMQIDPRRDHSLRVPRPDQTVSLGVPNVCNGCHTERSAEWAATTVREWYGHDPSGFQTFAEAFAAHEAAEPGAATALATLATSREQPTVVRASALARLADLPSVVVLEAARVGLADPDPLIRHAALSALEGLPPEQRAALVTPLLSDSVRIVRQQAAWLLAPATASLQLPAARSAFTRAANEFIASQRYRADRPENRVTLGTFFAQLGRVGEAEAEYRAALRMRPGEVAAYVNLADLYRAQGREAEAERVLRDGLERLPEDANLHHALGLSLARSGREAEARESLRRAAELAPEEPRFAYAYAVALHSGGEARQAIAVLETALERHPRDYDLLFALATFHRDAGERAAALAAAERLLATFPQDPVAAELVRSLQAAR
ncbi:MAG TPA: tetratricopeptide repeat protein [Longimicrobiaceae bacterium]